jgi:N-acyl-D-aspartate/D-glutamate deacylase
MSIFDFAFRRASVVDGTGGPSILATVYVSGDRIARIDQTQHDLPATHSFDAEGLALAPGFIDVHTHDDIVMITDPELPCKVSQGVTTVITGLCGYSPAPLHQAVNLPEEYGILLQDKSHRFPTFERYLDAVSRAQPAVNYLPLVGHSTLRLAVMDSVDRQATPSEIDAMGELLDEGMRAGAIGLSSGLAYAMAKSASTEEVVALCRRMSDRGGFYVTHIRDEGDHLIEAVDEALLIGREAGVPVIFSHHKALGCKNHGLTAQSLARIDAARATQAVGLDAYPYAFSSTSLTRERAARGGVVVVTRSETMPEMAGKTLSEIATSLGCSEMEAVDRLQPAGGLFYLMDEEDVGRVLSHDLTMIGSDGLPFDPAPHPRLWGTFPRVISTYVRKSGLLSLEQAVRRMTGLSADTFRIPERGYVREGYFADLVLFDPATITDHACATSPKAPATGIEAVLVNGAPPSFGTGRLLCSLPLSDV